MTGAKDNGVTTALVGDIGGTNARFAIRGAGGRLTRLKILPCADFANLGDAVEAYLDQADIDRLPRDGAIAVASPISGDRVAMTNRNWSFSTGALRRRLKFDRLIVVNDFVGVAMAVPGLKRRDLLKIGPGAPAKDAPIAVLGAGTGLGVSLLVPDGKRWLPVATEGGHVTLPAVNDEDAAIIAALRSRFGHVSAERVLSGPGLSNLYDAMAAIAGKRAATSDPSEITDRALSGNDPLAAAVLDSFCAMLGTVAGNLALTGGARGGLYIAGGIVPRFGRQFARSSFRARFEDKGRFRSYLRAIPTYLVTADQPALMGLTRLLDQAE